MHLQSQPSTCNRCNLQPNFIRFLTILLFLPLLVRAHTPAEEMAGAVNNFLAALTPEQRTKATYEMKDEERFDWHFIPKGREGMPVKGKKPAQPKLAAALIS